MIFIKNVKLFTLNIRHKCHWSKLPKLIKIMREQCLSFPSGANLCGANLCGADLCGANLYGANLRGADLYGANLCGANLYGTNLCGTNLCGTNLCGANLCGADLCGANLYGANLCGANLYGTDQLKGKPKNCSEKLKIQDYCLFERFGSENRRTLFFQTEIGIVVQCGCFWGTIEAFKKQVKKVHGKNKHGKCYQMMAQLAELRLGAADE